MTKTICDICGCEINQPSVFITGYGKTEVIIHHEGRTLDICNVCRNKLVRYAFKDMRGIVDPANSPFQKEEENANSNNNSPNTKSKTP